MNDGELIGRVEGLLGELESVPDPAARELALATVQAVLELDEHLLLLHGLHPVSVEERVRDALEAVRPYLGSHGGDVELVEVADGVARVRMHGSCEGCPASAMTLKLAIEEAVLKAAPDVEGVEQADDAPAA